jgi:DUF1680 family protein
MRTLVAWIVLPLCGAPLLGAVQADVTEAREFPLGDVRLLDGPFRAAMLRNADYLLSLEPDRLLHNTRELAGLNPKAERYGGWEEAGIAGHTLGHYLTAISQQYAATGDPRFKKRIDYIVGEMTLCQKAYGDGYIGALPPLELRTLRGFKQGIIEPSGPHTFKGGAWVPWYTEHKVLNGLKDAWVLGGNLQARDVALKLADFTDDITKGLSPDQLQTMLSVEHGGMMDVLAQIYELTGNPKYLEVSRRFYHRAVLDPLAAEQDVLPGLHANTQIPKVIGEAVLFEATGEKRARTVSEYFWADVVRHHSWVIGGNSDFEYFFDEGLASHHLTSGTAETCNTYNMLKLTEHLISWEPRVELSDFYERALYNDILASQDPEEGQFTYFMSLEPGHFKTFSTPTNSFWCCVGTGMENHTKYNAAIYVHSADTLYVNLFIPSELTWRDKGLVLRLETAYPRDGNVKLEVVSGEPAQATVRIRCPGWAGGPIALKVDGEDTGITGMPGTYVSVRRAWKKGDVLSLTVPMAVRIERLPYSPQKVAFLYGPVVLAGDLGPGPDKAERNHARDQRDNIPVPSALVPILVLGSSPLEASLVRAADGSLVFTTAGLDHPRELTLRPFWEISYDRYTVYWDVMPYDQWKFRDAPEIHKQ